MVNPATCDSRVGCSDPVCASGDRDDELDLPVGVDREFDDVRRSDDAARPLGEHGRLVGHAEDALLCVRPVVEADGEHLRRSWHGCLQLLHVDLAGAARHWTPRPTRRGPASPRTSVVDRRENRLSLAEATSTTAPSTNVLKRPARLNRRMNREHMRRRCAAHLSTIQRYGSTVAAMRVGVDLPYFAHAVEIRDYVQAAQGLGDAHIGFSEHIVSSSASPFPPGLSFDEPWHESFTLLAFLAAITEDIEAQHRNDVC